MFRAHLPDQAMEKSLLGSRFQGRMGPLYTMSYCKKFLYYNGIGLLVCYIYKNGVHGNYDVTTLRDSQEIPLACGLITSQLPSHCCAVQSPVESSLVNLSLPTLKNDF